MTLGDYYGERNGVVCFIRSGHLKSRTIRMRYARARTRMPLRVSAPRHPGAETRPPSAIVYAGRLPKTAVKEANWPETRWDGYARAKRVIQHQPRDSIPKVSRGVK
jgi:hypothetical protein